MNQISVPHVNSKSQEPGPVPGEATNQTPFIDLEQEMAALYARRAILGDICFMLVPYTDGSGRFEDRPVVVLGHYGFKLVVAPMTTHKPRDKFDIGLSSKALGLPRHGTVRCSEIITLSRYAVRRIASHVSHEVLEQILAVASTWFQQVILVP